MHGRKTKKGGFMLTSCAAVRRCGRTTGAEFSRAVRRATANAEVCTEQLQTWKTCVVWRGSRLEKKLYKSAAASGFELKWFVTAATVCYGFRLQMGMKLLVICKMPNDYLLCLY